MRSALSAAVTCGASASSSVWTAIAARPSVRRVRRIRSAISPRWAISTASKRGAPGMPAMPGLCAAVIAASHPEHAARGGAQRGAGDDVQGQAQHGASAGGFDDPVVPEPGGGVVGAALRLVLLDDGAAERGLLGLAPGAAGRLDPLAAHGGEHGRGLG